MHRMKQLWRTAFDKIEKVKDQTKSADENRVPNGDSPNVLLPALNRTAEVYIHG